MVFILSVLRCRYKVRERFEFPTVLDMYPYTVEGLAEAEASQGGEAISCTVCCTTYECPAMPFDCVLCFAMYALSLPFEPSGIRPSIHNEHCPPPHRTVLQHRCDSSCAASCVQATNHARCVQCAPC
jgi:hypothetical protein